MYLLGQPEYVGFDRGYERSYSGLKSSDGAAAAVELSLAGLRNCCQLSRI